MKAGKRNGKITLQQKKEAHLPLRMGQAKAIRLKSIFLINLVNVICGFNELKRWLIFFDAIHILQNNILKAIKLVSELFKTHLSINTYEAKCGKAYREPFLSLTGQNYPLCYFTLSNTRQYYPSR